jgi:hypothetical protein
MRELQGDSRSLPLPVLRVSGCAGRPTQERPDLRGTAQHAQPPAGTLRLRRRFGTLPTRAHLIGELHHARLEGRGRYGAGKDRKGGGMNGIGKLRMVRAPQDETLNTDSRGGTTGEGGELQPGKTRVLVREPGVDGDGPFFLFSHAFFPPSTPRHLGRQNFYIDHARHHSNRHTDGNTRTDENPPLR